MGKLEGQICLPPRKKNKSVGSAEIHCKRLNQHAHSRYDHLVMFICHDGNMSTVICQLLMLINCLAFKYLHPQQQGRPV